MPDIEAVVANAVEDATSGDVGGDESGGDVATPQEMPTEAAAAPETADASAEPAEPNDLDRLLEEAGIKFQAPAPGQREHRIPQSRFRKLAEKVRTTLQAKHDAALKEVNDRLTPAQQAQATLNNLDRIAATNPRQFMEIIANAHPAFRPALQAMLQNANPAAAAAAPAAPKPAADDPMPKPNATFPDGSKGYDAEGLEALFAWQGRQAERIADARADAAARKVREEFAPLMQSHQAQEARARNLPIVQRQMANARKTWGEAFDTNIDAIHTAIKAPENRGMSFEAVVASVLVPKLVAKVTTARTDVQKELNKRPAAVTAPAAGGKTPESTGPRTTEDVIRQAIASQRAAGRVA